MVYRRLKLTRSQYQKQNTSRTKCPAMNSTKSPGSLCGDASNELLLKVLVRRRTKWKSEAETSTWLAVVYEAKILVRWRI